MICETEDLLKWFCAIARIATPANQVTDDTAQPRSYDMAHTSAIHKREQLLICYRSAVGYCISHCNETKASLASPTKNNCTFIPSTSAGEILNSLINYHEYHRFDHFFSLFEKSNIVSTPSAPLCGVMSGRTIGVCLSSLSSSILFHILLSLFHFRRRRKTMTKSLRKRKTT